MEKHLLILPEHSKPRPVNGSAQPWVSFVQEHSRSTMPALQKWIGLGWRDEGQVARRDKKLLPKYFFNIYRQFSINPFYFCISSPSPAPLRETSHSTNSL